MAQFLHILHLYWLLLLDSLKHSLFFLIWDDLLNSSNRIWIPTILTLTLLLLWRILCLLCWIDWRIQELLHHHPRLHLILFSFLSQFTKFTFLWDNFWIFDISYHILSFHGQPTLQRSWCFWLGKDKFFLIFDDFLCPLFHHHQF